LARLVIVSNRVPAARERTQPAGGLTVALKDAIRRRETLWFGWSGHLTETLTASQPVVRPGRPTFATIDLPQEAFRDYYEGFSNSSLWPLLHWRPGLAEFRREELDAYNAVNEMFATALAPLLQPDDVLWVHDYHLIPLGAALRARGATQRMGFFLHVPFPPAPVFDTLPQADRLLKALGAYDLVGVQTTADAGYLQAAVQGLGESVPVAAFPVGIDAGAFEKLARQAAAVEDAERLRASLTGRSLILGVDRLDYSKGLPERFRGYAQLLRRFPGHRNRVTFIQVAPVSRGTVAHYRALRRELDELAGRINGEIAEFDWTPLRYMTRALPRASLAGFHRLARVALVTPLRDGMNLVAKEFVAAQTPEDPGVVVLSRFAGAAEELTDALLVNPSDPDEIASALDTALSMPLEERQQRWEGMMQVVRRHSARAWAESFLERLADPAAQVA
jgi:trehalose 6-phosphate synthase